MNRLRSRSEYLAVAKGVRAVRPGFVLQAIQSEFTATARFGFTVSRKVGGAVIRNRVRRRLKELARRAVAATGTDYVLVGRKDAAKISFSDMAEDLASAMRQVAESRKFDRHRPIEQGVVT